jgi:hypothetical protein
MGQVTRNEESNTITVELTDPAAYHCFQQGINDRKQWSRHPETRELADTVINNNKHSQIIVQYQGSHLPLKQINR